MKTPAKKATPAAVKTSAKGAVPPKKVSSKSPVKVPPKKAQAKAASAKTPSAGKPLMKVKPAAKSTVKSSVKAVTKAVTKVTAKAAAQPAPKTVAKAVTKAATQALAKSSSAKAPVKKTVPAKAPVAQAPGKKAVQNKKPVVNKPAPKAKPSVAVPVKPVSAVKPKLQPGKAVTAKAAASPKAAPKPEPVKTPVPPKAAPSLVAAPVVPALPAGPSDLPIRSSRPSARLAQITVPSMPQAVASTAAKASFLPSMPTAALPTPIAAVKKDPKLANNWKNKSVEQLSDAEVLAMPDSEYMNDVQMAFFRLKLVQLKQGILNNAGETTEHLREDTVVVPDPADRATIEEEHALELRTRDRERKLLKKIEQSIARIDAGDYGYCDETGEPIGVGRLLARPTATLSLEAQQRRELKQKMFGD